MRKLFTIIQKTLFFISLILPFVTIACAFFICGNSTFFGVLLGLLLSLVIAQFVHIRSTSRQTLFVSFLFSLLVLTSSLMFESYKIIALILMAFSIFMIIAISVFRYIVEHKKPLISINSNTLFNDKTVMMFVPHEDDEINLYGSMISNYLENGSNVKLVFLTNGDYYGIGTTRLKEALATAKALGLDESDVIFLGYSDTLTDKNSKHIYNSVADELCISKSKHTSTYALENHYAYNQDNAFTKQNILCDIEAVINDYKPNVVFCCDYDWHPDHRALSLFFDEALSNVLKLNLDYRPKVYKGFAYSTAWESFDDFYAVNMCSSKSTLGTTVMFENESLNWDERIRFPVAKMDINTCLQSTLTFKILSNYASQNACNFAEKVVNNDKVFFEKAMDDVFVSASIEDSHGKNPNIVGLKTSFSNNVIDKNEKLQFSRWNANHRDSIKITLPCKADVKRIVIHHQEASTGTIRNAVICSNGVQFETGYWNQQGVSSFDVDFKDTTEVSIMITDCVKDCYISKIEGFSIEEQPKINFIKLVNSCDDFCYDYKFTNGNEEMFSVYSYPNVKGLDFKISVEGEIKANMLDDKIRICCEEGCSGYITISSTEFKNIYDKVFISHPTRSQINKISTLQKLDQLIWGRNKSRSYYLGIIKRIPMIFKNYEN